MATLNINLNKIIENYKTINKICTANEKELLIVTKCINSNYGIVEGLFEVGLKTIGDTSIKNLKNAFKGLKKLLMRVPSNFKLNEFNEFDYFYLSELEIMKNLAKQHPGKIIKIFLPIEFGELREGVESDKVIELIEQAIKIENIEIYALTGNFGCLCGLLPDTEKYQILIDIKKRVKRELNYEIKKLSVGGTVVFEDLYENKIPKEINHIRMGEGIFLGYNTSLNMDVKNCNKRTFILSGEILEISQKSIKLRGNYGLNAFGDNLIDKSKDDICSKKIKKRKRAVLDFGMLFSGVEKLLPIDKGVKTVGNSYDFTVVDLEMSSKQWKIGDKIDFYTDYNILSYAMLACDIEKRLV